MRRGIVVNFLPRMRPNKRMQPTPQESFFIDVDFATLSES